MTTSYARWAASPIDEHLLVEDAGLTVASNAASSRNGAARSDISQVAGTHGVEVMFWGDDDLEATFGVVSAAAALTSEVGMSNGAGWRLRSGQIMVNGNEVAAGLPLPSKEEPVGMQIVIGTPSRVRFYRGSQVVAEVDAALSGALHFAVSIASTKAHGLRCIVNAGQWQGASPAVRAANWAQTIEDVPATFVSSEDYMSDPSDTPANQAYQGLISTEGLATIASVSFWPWDGASRGGTAQLRVQDADGALDALALSSARDVPVAVRQVLQGQPLSSASPVSRYVLDRVDIESDGGKVLILRDAHDDMDSPLNCAVFLPPQGDTLAWQPQPVVIGAVRSAPGVKVNSDGSAQWLSDAPLASVGAVLDRGAAIVAGTGYTLAAGGQQLAMTSPPLGPLVADVSTQVDMTPATLRQALAAVFGRIGKSAWSGSDADAMDLATGYAGVGYYTGQAATPRQALSSILPSYTADWWQDGDGVLRLSRLTDPEDATDAELVFELDWRELQADLVVMPDLAPNLSRRMGYQPNALVLTPGDLITDLVQLPPARRQQLTAEYRGQVYAAGTLASRYAHAETAAPMVSRFDRREDAQAEIDRVVRLYAVPRYFYAGRVTGRTDLQLRPGQVGRITYHRYGLQSGRKVLITAVTSNRVTGEHALKMWGA
ncbi:hypothetical protein JWH04_20660 [Xanthomonas melonis]|uniref:hypothetical protein n=1 Tax=Xanthomonas melonis TaxID=56456 RepID=UPI001E290506|nr:hypothetical protein [Xanthomonas melonis]MCD0281322.1 hypothetical protein [Xanthomonas melonis]